VLNACLPAITVYTKRVISTVPFISPDLIAWHHARLRVVAVTGKSTLVLLHNHRHAATSASATDLQDAVDAC
jgi:hypothetical protein